MEKQFYVELSSDNAKGDAHYYSSLGLPAREYEIRDALEKVRAVGRRDISLDISIYESEKLPELNYIRMSATSIEELNFLAKRLAVLSEDEWSVLRVVISRIIPEDYEDKLINVKDLVNVTYGLDEVSIISGVHSDEQLGEIVIENDMHEDVSAVPDKSLYLLDKKKIGRMQRESDGGIFSYGKYIVAGEYEMMEVYDEENLPQEAEEPFFVFRLKAAGNPGNDFRETEENSEWISLPILKDDAEKIAENHGEYHIEECSCYGFESSLPQITEGIFGDMKDFYRLNMLATSLMYLSSEDQVKFKAVLEAEKPMNLSGVIDIFEHLSEYEMSSIPYCDDEFFREYLLHHLDSGFDRGWIDTLPIKNEGEHLLKRLGASYTEYGYISARGRSLYEMVRRDEQAGMMIKPQEFMEVDSAQETENEQWRGEMKM